MSKPQEDKLGHVPIEIIEELLTESELRMVKQRLLIVEHLEEGLSIRAVAERVRVGTDTVVRMARKLEASPKLRKLFLKNPHVSTSKWVFGGVGSKEQE